MIQCFPIDERGKSESIRSEEHTSELQSRSDLVCRLLLEKKKKTHDRNPVSQRQGGMLPISLNIRWAIRAIDALTGTLINMTYFVRPTSEDPIACTVGML